MSNRQGKQSWHGNIPQTVLFIVLILVAMAGASLAKDFQRNFRFDGQKLELSNLIGEIKVMESTGSQFVVDVSVLGKDADEALLNFNANEGSTNKLALEFPINKHAKYVYPALGKGSSTTMYFQSDNSQDKSWLRKIFSGLTGKKIKVEGCGRGLEMWADVVVMVPKGKSLVLVNGVGAINAEDCNANLNLDINRGSITAKSITGNLIADTGSGQVIAENIIGDASIDTGSGSVKVSGFKGDDLHIDTGSGGVVVDYAMCQKMDIDTGSGSVRARNVETDHARIDTGSGSVLLQLDRMGSGKFVLDTGSGNVELIIPENASAAIVADTGSGGINMDLVGAIISTKERDRVELILGDGEASVRLDTGSGSVTIGH